jgi:tetratricopeptide (TPR) repeat protein
MKSSRSWLLGLGAVLAAAGAAIFFFFPSKRGHAPREEKGELHGIRYVADRACAECHRKEFDSWSISHHQWAMQPAGASTVRGDFNNASFEHFGVRSRFFRKGERYFVNTEGPDGKLADFEIRYTFGVEPLQQYLIEFPGGRLQSLTVAWHTEGKRWFPLYPHERIKPGDPLHWTGRYQNWNLMCAECHSTNLRENYDAGADTYSTTWAEINIGCQACHGPGEKHLEWAAKRDQAQPNGLLASPYRDARGEVESCAPCHSRRHSVALRGAPGERFLDFYALQLISQGMYFADGQQQDEVYIYGSFLQSLMHERGVRCTDCHDAHSLSLKEPGNDLCGACHRPVPPERFQMRAALRKNFDTPNHHFHKTGTPGAQCVNCHMAERTYMGVDPRRDHSFRVPRPDLSAKTGAPDACTQCHKDKAANWAAAEIRKRSGRTPKAHFGEVFAAAWAGEPEAGARLASLASDRDQPAFVRASAVQQLRGSTHVALPLLRGLLSDADPLLRHAAASLADSLPPAERVELLAPRLKDRVRAVRVEAARALASVPPQFFSAAQRAGFDLAIAEFTAALMARADMPSSRFNLGALAAAQGRNQEALALYRKAIQMDPSFLPAYFNLASALNATGHNAEAESLLRQALQWHPGHGELNYSLGLLLAELKRMPEAIAALEKAARATGAPRMRYNYGLALLQTGRPGEAETELVAAASAAPDDPSIRRALLSLYMQSQRWNAALTQAERLARLSPSDPNLIRLISELRSRLTGP